MASHEEKSIGEIPWPGLVAVLVALLGLIATRPAIESPRPAPPGPPPKVAAADYLAPARLWQDPLTTARGGEQKGRSINDVVTDGPAAVAAGEPVLFLFDCVDPENTAESVENRRRERYAALSALSTAGYVPVEPDHIRFAQLEPAPRTPADDRAFLKQQRPADLKWEKKMPLPYEWFQAQDGKAGVAPQFRAICVLWVNSLTDSHTQLTFLCRLKLALAGGCPGAAFAIAGKIDTGQLTAMLDEQIDPEVAAVAPDHKPLNGVTLYVCDATAPVVRTKAVRDTGLELEYLIDTDDRLAEEVIGELKRRWLDPSDDSAPLAVIAEWDTGYGRGMHDYFDKALRGKGHVHHYSYLRGLDGRALGGAAAKEPGPAAGEAPGAPKQPPGEDARAAEGDSQIDYLPRLAEEMKSHHESFKAIGIVGSDVYDKLVLLRALRPRFPGAVFFTTDLDARLLQPRDYPDTRNLLIASHFGTCLGEKLQAKVAPFRSSYDTASYLGCLRAVGDKRLSKKRPDDERRDDEIFVDVIPLGDKPDPDKVRKIVPHGQSAMPVHLYAVGRDGAYELTLYDKTHDPLGSPNPRLEPWVAKTHRPWWLLAVALLGVALLLPVSRTWQRFFLFLGAPGAAVWERLTRKAGGTKAVTEGSAAPAPRQTWRDALLLLTAAVGGVLAVSILWAHTSADEEPFTLFQGLSIWPTVVLRLLACALCAYYVLAASERLSRQNARVREEFFDEKFYARRAPAAPPSGWRALARAFSWEPDEQSDVRALYDHLERHGRPRWRALRCALMAALNVLLLGALWLTFDPAVVRARGNIALTWYVGVLIVTLPALVVLVMFVVDCTVLAFRFVTSLARLPEGKHDWPEALLDEEARHWGVSPPGEGAAVPDATRSDYRRAAGQWLRVRLIDSATNVVARLIYCPFVVLLILFVAQNRLFNDWHWNVPFAVIALGNAAAAVACAWQLQRAAKHARAQALHTLDDLLRARVGPAQDEVRERLSRIRSDVAHFRTGAFASVYQNPVFGAVLLPLLGGGGLTALEALLEYLH